MLSALLNKGRIGILYWVFVKVKLKFYQKGDIYLNLVMEYMSHPLSKIIRDSRKRGEIMAVNDIRLFSYQIFKAFSYLEVKKICHRDVKP